MDQLPAFQISSSLIDEDEEPSIVFELSNIEYSAIGMVTVQWSYLEHALLLVHQMICEYLKEEISDDAMSYSFSRRLRAWFDLLKAHESEIKNIKFFLSLHQRISKLMHERHKIIHGMWDYDTSNPFLLKLFSTRPKLNFENASSIDLVYSLATEIGKINCILTHMPIGDKRISDMTQTGVAKKDGNIIGHMHRSMFLSEEDRERLFPELSLMSKNKL